MYFIISLLHYMFAGLQVQNETFSTRFTRQRSKSFKFASFLTRNMLCKGGYCVFRPSNLAFMYSCLGKRLLKAMIFINTIFDALFQVDIYQLTKAESSCRANRELEAAKYLRQFCYT